MNLNLFDTARIKENRLPWIDYARGIAIFLVLYRHIFEGIKRSGIDTIHFSYLEHANIIFFSFRMPLFFMISGIFIGGSLFKRGLKYFIMTKWKLLLYPYLLWATVQVTLQLSLSKYVNADRSYRDYLYILYAPREIDQFWYLYALFNTSVLYAILLIKGKISTSYQLILGFIMFLVSSFVVQHKISLGFIYDILHYYIFIALGGVLSSFIKDKKNEPLFSSWKLFLVILPIFVVCQGYFLNTNLSQQSYSYVEDYQPLRFLIIALSGCVFMINISFILQKYKALLTLRVIGYYSLYIYLMHVLASSAARILLTKVFGIDQVLLLLPLGILVGLFVPVIFYNLAMKLGAWWLFSLERKSPETHSMKNRGQLAN
ncbi:MAG TPA: acyltransferase [Puia sp.]|jgi:fucose 4-O-acetylase-like acetyltransferase|nr:acyltransferase [Puia sp.]